MSNDFGFTHEQLKELAKFRAELNEKEYYGVYDASEDLWYVYDVDDAEDLFYEQPDADLKDDEVEWYDPYVE